MKNQNTVFITIVSALAFALAPVTQAAPGPLHWPPPPTIPEAANLPVIAIHSTDNVIRGRTGSFILDMRSAVDTKSALTSGGRYVNFKLSGTAIA